MTIDFIFDNDPMAYFIGFEELNLVMREAITEGKKKEFRPESYPHHNICKVGDEYVIELYVPGFSSNAIAVSFEDSILTVIGSRRWDLENSEKLFLGGMVLKNFIKRFRVSNAVHPTEVSCKDGVLSITLTEMSVNSSKALVSVEPQVPYRQVEEGFQMPSTSQSGLAALTHVEELESLEELSEVTKQDTLQDAEYPGTSVVAVLKEQDFSFAFGSLSIQDTAVAINDSANDVKLTFVIPGDGAVAIDDARTIADTAPDKM